jgi:glycosyltransferase involved in cell wall biosynthesis
MTVYIVDLESIPTRYTCEWKSHLPELIKKHRHEVVVISGPDDLPNNTTPGMFLNFSATNIYKSVQVEKFSRLFSDGKIKDGDYFLFTDAWHPGVINLKYMADLLGVKIKIGGCWHAGSYDPQDGLGRLVGDKPWVRHAEKSFFHAIDHNYFATDFHIEMFASNLLEVKEDNNNEVINHFESTSKIVRTGWPMDYMSNTLNLYKGMKKRDLILFPHRIAPEKQVEIFRDLKAQLPQYEFVVCQDQELTKNEYHNLLGEAKIVFSCSLQETLGIGCYEGAIVDAIPMVPDRLSYSEMYYDGFTYPTEWTRDWDSYMQHRQELCHHIIVTMTYYEKRLPTLRKQTQELTDNFFSATALLENIK